MLSTAPLFTFCIAYFMLGTGMALLWFVPSECAKPLAIAQCMHYTSTFFIFFIMTCDFCLEDLKLVGYENINRGKTISVNYSLITCYLSSILMLVFAIMMQFTCENIPLWYKIVSYLSVAAWIVVSLVACCGTASEVIGHVKTYYQRQIVREREKERLILRYYGTSRSSGEAGLTAFEALSKIEREQLYDTSFSIMEREIIRQNLVRKAITGDQLECDYCKENISPGDNYMKLLGCQHVFHWCCLRSIMSVWRKCPSLDGCAVNDLIVGFLNTLGGKTE